MPDPSSSPRECPRPVDGRVPLIAHQIDARTCRGRQAAHYHKCFACEHFAHGEGPRAPDLPPLGGRPPVVELVPQPPPASRPSQGAPAALRVG